MKPPETGYVPSLREAAKQTGKESWSPFVYYFKISSERLGGAKYGKIVEGPRLISNDGGWACRFTYMLNEEGSRNMEPDLDHSKVPRLGHLEYRISKDSSLDNR